MTDSYNPYSATQTTQDFGSSTAYPQSGDASMVNQLTIVGVLQIVLGVCEVLAGAFLAVMAVVIVNVMAAQPPGAQAPPAGLIAGMQIYYWAAGIVGIVSGIVRVVTGIGCFRFRGRIWLIVSLTGGLASAMTFYCAPFSVAMCIYGLIVAFNNGVAKAYELGRAGVPAAEIKHRFMVAQYGNLSPSPPIQGGSE